MHYAFDDHRCVVFPKIFGARLKLSCVSTVSLSNCLEIPREVFPTLAAVTRNDYTEGIPKIGIKRNLKKIKKMIEQGYKSILFIIYYIRTPLETLYENEIFVHSKKIWIDKEESWVDVEDNEQEDNSRQELLQLFGRRKWMSHKTATVFRTGKFNLLKTLQIKDEKPRFKIKTLKRPWTNYQDFPRLPRPKNPKTIKKNDKKVIIFVFTFIF